MRASLNGVIRRRRRVSVAQAAEAARIQADGVLLAPNVRLKPDTTYDGPLRR